MAGKTQIVDQVVAGGATRAQAAAAVDAVLDAITASLAAGERVTLTGFGTFEPAARPARTARNPRTGDVVDVAATTVARFRPGSALRTAVAAGAAPALGTRPASSRGTVGTSEATTTSDEVVAEAAPGGRSKDAPKGKGTSKDAAAASKQGKAAASATKHGKATASATKHGKSTAPAKKSSAAKADGKKHAKDGKGKGKKHASAAHSGKKHAKK